MIDDKKNKKLALADIVSIADQQLQKSILLL
jgi:ribosome-associated protein YbcJ (S4-like RNA binding protein)